MPDGFFVSKKTKKRKRDAPPKASGSSSSKRINGKGRPNGTNKSQSKGKTRARDEDEELSSDLSGDEGGIDDMDLRASDGEGAGRAGSEEEDELETPAEKRLRLAKVFLEDVKEKLAEETVGFDAAEMDREIIAARLKQDAMEHSGKLHNFVALSLDIPGDPPFLRTRGHKHAVTSAVASSSTSSSRHMLYTAGKDGSVVVTDLSSGKYLTKLHKLSSKAKGKGKEKAHAYNNPDIPGHTDGILALALSPDGTLLVSGGIDRRIIVWDVSSPDSPPKYLRSFTGHKDTITALSFRLSTPQLFSASMDRTLKLFDLSPSVMGYVDTLFGHQDSVSSISALRGETAVSCGGRDRTVRFWKVVDESQLVFRGGGRSRLREVMEGGVEGLGDEGDEEKKGKEERYEEGSVDVVCMIDECTFASGGDSGTIALWITSKKKPVHTTPLAHGLQTTYSSTEGALRTPRWITALACLRYGDVLASGSYSDGVRLWRICTTGTNEKGGKGAQKGLSLECITVLPAPGIVNSLQVFTVPRTMTDSWSWLARKSQAQPPSGGEVDVPTDALAAGEDKTKGRGESLVVVAALGKETRLGRWMTLKGEGASNGSRTFVLHLKSHS